MGIPPPDHTRSSSAERAPTELVSGDFIPQALLPTPDQAPRPRNNAKRQRLNTAKAPLEPTLTALQRLSLSRKTPAQSSVTPSPPLAGQSTQAAAPGASSSAEKPKSKLALLAEQRRAAAAGHAATTPSISTPSGSGATTPSTLKADEASPSKPLSKLAQKMAAARAAKASGSTPTPQNSSSYRQSGHAPDATMAEADDEDDTDTTLFPKATADSATPTKPRSVFFDLLTTTKSGAALPSSSSLSMHLPAEGDVDELERRIRTAFGPDVDSPDDLVLRARQGRAGTAAMAPTVDSKT